MLKVSFSSSKPGSKTCTLSGRLDSNTFQQLDTELAPVVRSGINALVFDLGQLEYISSAGIRSVFKARKDLKALGGQTMVLNPQPQVRKVFEIVKAMPLDSLFSSVEEMDRYLDKIQKQVVSGQ